MILAEPTMIELLFLCSEAREDEIEQYEALVGVWDFERAAIGFYNKFGIKFSLLNDEGTAICAGGWEEIIPGVWQSWMVGTDNYWEKYWRSITKYSRRVMDGLFDTGARRLQTGALASRVEACNWYVRGLKMEREGLCRSFGLKGEDMATFVRIKEISNG